MKFLNKLPLIFLLILILTNCSKKPSPPVKTPPSIHLTYGMPSNANKDNTNDYLLIKPEFALSYNCLLGTANWVSWKLDTSWLGNIEREDDFRPDSSIPDRCYQVRPNDYRGTGYDRGHITPSGDRTRNQTMNSATFVMSNMIPQTPENNREVWGELEEYSRDLVRQGKTIYIVAGGEGQKERIADQKITVPKHTWKVILISDNNGKNLETIAVWMPNNDKVANTDWKDYIVSVDQVEKKTGYDFFNTLDKDIQRNIEKIQYQPQE